MCYSRSITLYYCLLNKMGSMHWKNNSQEFDAYFPVFFNPSHHCEFLGYGGEGHQIQTPRPYDQHGEDIPTSCTVNCKITSAEGFPCGIFPCGQKYYKHLDTKELHCEALHHIFSGLLIPAVFFFTTAFLQTATSRSSLWEALPAPRKQPLRLPRYTLVTQTTSGGWQLLVSQKQRLAFICLFVTSVNGGRKSF